MNKTLSLIEEEEAEEYLTQGSGGAAFPLTGSLGGSQKVYIEDTLKDLSLLNSPKNQPISHSQTQSLLPEPFLDSRKEQIEPAIVKDIEQMERDFTSFLESMYT